MDLDRPFDDEFESRCKLTDLPVCIFRVLIGLSVSNILN